ncbi:MAG: hypothetical protein AB8H80_01260 [Planctomycetota bacterium]
MPESREELVLAVLTGACPVDDPRLRERLAADPELAEELRTLLATRDLVDRAGAEEGAVVRGFPGEELAKPARQASAVRQGWLAQPVWRTALALLLVVAVGAGAFALWNPGGNGAAGGTGPDAPRFLGGDFAIRVPAEPGQVFEFDYELVDEEYFEIEVWAVGEGARKPLFEDEATGSAWRPPAEAETWPAAVDIVVRVMTPDGNNAANSSCRYAR